MSLAEPWIEKAKEDFENGVFNNTHKKFSLSAFLFQQSAEKALKAVLLIKGKGLIKTHDCFLLAKECSAPQEVVESAEILSPYYMRTRYPDAVLVSLNANDVARLKSAAEKVLQWSQKKHY